MSGGWSLAFMEHRTIKMCKMSDFASLRKQDTVLRVPLMIEHWKPGQDAAFTPDQVCPLCYPHDLFRPQYHRSQNYQQHQQDKTKVAQDYKSTG